MNTIPRGAPLALGICVLLGACARKWTCDFTAQLVQRSGASAHDCGEAKGPDGGRPVATSPDGGSTDAGAADVPSDVDVCIANAFAAHEPFRAQYPAQGVDSKVVYGIAYDGKVVTILTYDSDPSGGSHQDPTIHAALCRDPRISLDTPRDATTPAPLECSSLEDLGQTCGEPQGR